MGKFFGASAKPIDASATYFYTLVVKRRTIAWVTLAHSTQATGYLIITPFHCLWSNTKRPAPVDDYILVYKHITKDDTVRLGR